MMGQHISVSHEIPSRNGKVYLKWLEHHISCVQNILTVQVVNLPHQSIASNCDLPLQLVHHHTLPHIHPHDLHIMHGLPLCHLLAAGSLHLWWTRTMVWSNCIPPSLSTEPSSDSSPLETYTEASFSSLLHHQCLPPSSWRLVFGWIMTDNVVQKIMDREDMIIDIYAKRKFGNGNNV